VSMVRYFVLCACECAGDGNLNFGVRWGQVLPEAMFIEVGARITIIHNFLFRLSNLRIEL
jgi:hypothetical protein